MNGAIARWFRFGSGCAQSRDGSRVCGTCRHFSNDRAVMERALPGLSALSSAQASVTASDGLCAHHQRLAGARGTCPAYSARME